MATLARAMEWYDTTRTRAFAWRSELAWPAKLLLAFNIAACTGLLAQVRLPLGFTPVPITGQVLGALLAGVVLGCGWGALSMGMYVGLGAAGVYWFNGLTGGLSPLAGITGGYILGFIPAAVLVGWLTGRSKAAPRFWLLCAIMLLGVAVIYFFGALQFSLVLHKGLGQTLALAVAPFIAVDVVKALVAASVARALLPQKA